MISQTKLYAALVAFPTITLTMNVHAIDIQDGKALTVSTQTNATPAAKPSSADVALVSDAADAANALEPRTNAAEPPSIEPKSPVCSPVALAVGIEHFSYDEAFAEDLVWSGYGDKRHENKLIHKDVKQPLQDLVKAAAKDKVALYPSSMFRSVRAQDAIVKRKVRQKQSPKTIYHTSSPAGFSEHHTGYAVDFAPINANFAKTKGYQWLVKNAEKYGWQQTFTPEFSAQTGVSEESWHWRYVGDERGQALFAPRSCQTEEVLESELSD